MVLRLSPRVLQTQSSKKGAHILPTLKLSVLHLQLLGIAILLDILENLLHPSKVRVPRPCLLAANGGNQRKRLSIRKVQERSIKDILRTM
jgi:hypothetical protein